MKQIIIKMCIILFSPLAMPVYSAPPVSQKAMSAFHESFPEVREASWHKIGDVSEVYFSYLNSFSCRIDYAADGSLLCTTRYYTAKELSPTIRAKVAEKFRGKKIYGVTEVADIQKVVYYIILHDDRYWYNIESDQVGTITLLKKLIRS